MPTSPLALPLTNALLVGLLALPVWIAWRYLQQPSLRWLMGGYVLAALLYAVAPLAQALLGTRTDLSAAILTPMVGLVFIPAVLSLLRLEHAGHRRWAWTLLATVAGGYVVALALGAPLLLRVGLLGAGFLACAALCFALSRTEPEAGLGLVGLSLLLFLPPLLMAEFLVVPGHTPDTVVEVPLVAIGLSVMTVLALRARREHAQTVARNMQLEWGLRSATTAGGAREPGSDAQGAVRLVDGFNRTVAHDVKGAISAVLAGTRYAQELLKQGDIAQALAFLPEVERQADAAMERVAAMQRLAQTQSLPLALQETSLERIATAALGEVKRQQPEHELPVPVYLLPLPTVLCDPGLMRVLFINLLSNAVKFSAGVPNATVHVGVLCDKPDEEPTYFVRDTGIGFDPEQAPELLTPFGRRGSAGGRSAGVGVSVALNIVERHGGRLWVEAELGHGATFFFTLGHPPVNGTSHVRPDVRAETPQPTV